MIPVSATPASFPLWVKESFAATEGRDLADLWFRRDGSEGWAAGGGGTILHLKSGRWHVDSVPSAPPVDWTAIAFNAEATLGFAVGSGGWIARYEGHRWSARREVPETQALTAVWVDADGSEAFAVGRGDVALRWFGEHWIRLPLRHDSVKGILLDVVANDRELWVRDSALISVYRRPGYTWLRDLTGYRASRMWAQPGSRAVWAAGVTDPGYEATRYSVLAVRPERTDTVDQIWVMPRAAWMSDTLGCGMVAGFDEPPDGPSLAPYWIYSVGRDLRPFMWPNVDPSADVRAIWVNHDCTAGWAVGSGGYAARLQRRPLRLREMRREGGTIEKLTGRYTLHPDSGVPNPSIDTLQLLHGSDTIRFVRGVHFVLDSTSGSPMAVRITDTGRAQSARFKNKPVALRFIVSYPVSTPAYRVAYEREGSFYVQGRSYRTIVVSLLVVLVVVTLWGLRYWRRGRALLSAAPGQRLQQRLPVAWLSDAIDMVLLLLLGSAGVRRRTFSRYLAEFQRRYVPRYPALPHLRVVECTALGPPGGPAQVEVQSIYKMLMANADRVLWVEDAQGLHGRDLLLQWGAMASRRGDIPVLLQLHDTSPIEDQIRRALQNLGGIPDGLQKVWEAGGFVFLLDDARAEYDESALLGFVQAERGRNFVIVCRSRLANIGACHLALDASL